MPLDCAVCPAPTALTTIPYNPCVDIPGKVARMIFQRYAAANNFDGTASPSTAIDLEASWSALPDASDDTKVVISPLLENVIFAEQEVLEDSENLDGAAIKVGKGPTMVSAEFRNGNPAQAAALDALFCERVPIVVYMLDNNGNFLCKLVASDIHNGLDISADTGVLIGPYREGARVNQFKHRIEFALKANWFNSLAVVAPESGFDPLTEIDPA